MPWLGTLTVVGIVLLVALIWVLVRMRMKDQLDELMAKRRGSCRIVSRADFLEGMEKIPVSLALDDDTLHYENADLQATLELQHVDEVEYDDETATGHSVVGKALRLRAHGHAFEFVLDQATARQWEQLLPARRVDQMPARAV
ncbi:MAG TPA: hypothetical protein VJZ76_21370 [Thermoanaerobaculia bacterium]|nr:hypothetical protein [Thermoanaerobaculia bacterium]